MGGGLVVGDLHVSAGHTRLVHGVGFTVERGGWGCLVGPNGAGKTTVLRAVVGLAKATGTITFDGAALPDAPRHRARLVAFVPQQPELPGDMSVLDYVLLGRLPHRSYLGAESTADVAVAAELCERLDLADFADRTLGTLSGGEVQRCVLARALAQEAPVLLLDEPTSALDIGHAQKVLELIDTERRSRGLTVLSTMHDLTVAGQYVDQVVLMTRGSAVASGPPAAVLTAETIERHYGARVEVLHDECGGLVVVPLRPMPGHRPT